MRHGRVARRGVGHRHAPTAFASCSRAVSSAVLGLRPQQALGTEAYNERRG